MQNLTSKITDPETLSDLSRINRVVFTNGIFDILHAGHVRYLEAARNLGDMLIVAVNDDASTRKLKGEGRPINALADRMTVLAALSSVSCVIPLRDTTNVVLLNFIKPTIWVKGGDYTLSTLNLAERALADSLGIQIQILPLSNGYSTTSTIGKITASR